MKPTKSTDTFRRVYRGGSWHNSTAAVVRAAFRGGIAPTLRDDSVGFRLTQTGCRQVLVNP